MSSSIAPARLSSLDVLRGLAAGAVVLSHAAPLLTPSFSQTINRFFDLGAFGVLLFFLCSGIIIPETLERHGSLQTFWIRRACRLYPLYWVSVAGAAMLYARGNEAMAGTPEVLTRVQLDLARVVLANATLFQEFMQQPHLSSVYWTLSFELLFYMLISMMFAANVLRLLNVVATGMAAMAVTFGALIILDMVTLSHPYALRNISYLAWLFLPAGFAVARDRLQSRLLLEFLATCMLIVACLAAPAMGFAWTLAYILFRITMLRPTGNFPAPLTGFGNISYSVYLFHPLIIAAVPFVHSALITAIVWSLLLIVCSVLTERWIEQPGIALGRRLTRRSIPAESPLRPDATPTSV